MKSRPLPFNLVGLLLWALFIHIPHPICSQETEDHLLSGLVTDPEGQPLPGANIRIKNTPYGTVTDMDGKYQLRGKWKKGAVIMFSYIGMKDVLMEFWGQKEQDAAMQSDDKALKEVSVTARQNINAIDLRARAGVVQTVDMKRLNEKPMMDMSLALQGSVPGLIVTNTGDLGSKPTIRIRGNSSLRKGDAANEPLYVLDGKVISSDAFMTLNPQDIKEIKVLKDAAACALYGIKAANGVLEITSQRGTNDGHVSVSYNFNMGVTMRGRRGVELMETDEKLEFERRLKNEATPGYRYSADYFRTKYPNSPELSAMIADGQRVLDSLRTINTDWFRELIRRSMYQRHNLSFKGGNEQTAYYISANYTMQGGMLPGNDTQRATVRMSLDQQLGKIGILSLSVDGGYAETDTPTGTSFTPASLVYNLNPYEQPSGGKLWSYPNRTYSDLLNQYSASSSDKRGGFSGSINLDPLEGLTVAAVAGIDFLLTEGLQFTPASSYAEQQSGAPQEALGKLNKYKNTVANISSNIRATYTRTFKEKHDLTLSANMDYYLTDNDNVSITGYGVGDHPSAALINQSLEKNRKPSVGSLKEKTAQIGYGLVGGYTYNSLYDLFATYKWDASSVLPKDKRWNGAWAVGAGWTPSNYRFLKDNKVLTRLNFKTSYGVTASLAGVSAASTIGTFAYSENTYGNQRLLELLALYNTDLKPEQTTSIDAGISLEFFKRLTVDFGWYKRETADALLDVPVPASNGFSTMKRNIGVLRNDGIELSASMKIIDTDVFTFRLGGSFAYNSNKVTDLYFTDKLYANETSLIPDFQIGKAYDIVYGLKSLGINPRTGLPVFEGADGREFKATDQLKREDFVELGHSTPPYSGTINVTFTYRDLDLDMDFYYVAGGVRQYNYTYVRDMSSAHQNAVHGLLDKMWFENGDQNKIYYSPFYSSAAIETLSYPNTNTVGKSNYLRMSMLSLRYRIPRKFLSRRCPFIKYANIAMQASNLFTLTPYNESDPETGQLGAAVQPVLTMNLSVTF
ncbi:MAG: SusC/RagA family TonB-linked outer membrane protein [Paraprevotella sp.]|nr:SusC/RagA family TonB-linked outer membrane protein [Paraprevotella sp.]